MTEHFFASKRMETLYPLPRSTAIVTQSENGPCPLLAVVNALLLSSEIEPSDLNRPGVGDVGGCTTEGLTRCLFDVIDARLRRRSENASDEVRMSAEMAAAEAKSATSDAARGLDVNVRFDDCERFEFTREMSFFDACGTRVMHGWVVGEGEHGGESVDAVGRDGYNRLTERLIELRTTVMESDKADVSAQDEAKIPSEVVEANVERAGDREERELLEHAMKLSLEPEKSARDEALARAMREADLIEEFLNTTASQLTSTGLAQMRDRIKEREYVVWFRNNHFSVVTKLDGQLYALVTDQGYLHEPDVVWEGLGGAKDGMFFTSKFEPFVPHAESGPEAMTATSASSASSPIPDAFLRASSAGTGESTTNTFEPDVEKSDHALALELQAQRSDTLRRPHCAPRPNVMEGWTWDSFTKGAADAAETTRLLALKSAKRAEIMYIENQISSAMSAFGTHAFPALERGESVTPLYEQTKRDVDRHRADVAECERECQRLDQEIANVGCAEAQINATGSATPDVRASAPRSTASLQDL
ncbi:hypothetical protein BE221DRAFT_216089 [Ostreococcus tauri]|uniref:MINDY deubiquitinase domain-containing protein n=1 Tax=Ostreococcus tauri TaxID=70448 RepID=A0A1Y5IHU1_OSTTA|nr:hypothetical protein BE221DRAFT_216089 [Ostreococcus tauri]